jgi:hypothetical protein
LARARSTAVSVAGARQGGAFVAQKHAQGLVVAALDDGVGHGLGHGGAAADGAHMALAARAHHADQIGLGQHRRGAEDGGGDGLGLVIGQAADQLMRGVRRLGEPFGQFGAHGRLHGVGQVGQDGAVEGGLGLRTLGGAEEAVGQLTQQGAALGAGLLLRQGDQVRQARAGLGRGSDGGGGGGAVAHGSIGSSASGAARRRPWASRITAGGSGGWARSSEDGVSFSSTGMASR